MGAVLSGLWARFCRRALDRGPRPEDIVVDKWTWGIFASTDLESQLRARGIKRLLVCGIATNVCVTNMVFQVRNRCCA